ncbi:MAG: DUF805 domain-containing protein [Sphingomonadaceae bacterium]|nr:DUF805 domain-containing protein [Sphingomonadaceae bacterium]
MLGSIKYNLSHLGQFSGRDARQTFWYYVLFLVVLQFGVGIIAAIPLYIDMFTGAFQAAQAGLGEREMQAMMMANMGDQMRTQVWISAAVGVVISILLAASFVRRLHDTGFTGWIAVIPLGTYLFSLGYNIVNLDTMLAMMERAMSATEPSEAFAMQGQMASTSLISWVGILVVIGFGVLKSQDGPNKYGDAPVRF